MEKILSALSSLENKVDTKMNEIKQDLDSKFDQMLEKIAGMERSLNFAHAEVTDLKEKQCNIQTDTMMLKEELTKCRNEIRLVESIAKEKLNEIERRSREYNIRIHGLVNAKDEKNHKKLVAKTLVEKGLVPEGRSVEDTMGTIEIAHPLATKGQYIARLYSRPCRAGIIQEAKAKLNNKTGKDGIKVYEDFTKVDYERKLRAIPQMRTAYAEGKKVRFQRGKLIIDGKNVPINEEKEGEERHS